MAQLLSALQLPASLQALHSAARVRVVQSAQELREIVETQTASGMAEVHFSLCGNRYPEATIRRHTNGFAVNFADPKIRRRDPNCTVVADDLPTTKPRFVERFGYPFSRVRDEMLQWLQTQELLVFAFDVGGPVVGARAAVVVPESAAFFALALVTLQGIAQWPDDQWTPDAVLFVAPPFRHTHFGGEQVVVHDRSGPVYEIWANNLYPGPPAKKGWFGFLLHRGESSPQPWIVAHCSAVRVRYPDSRPVIMAHEGASGGGKSETLTPTHASADGRVALGRNGMTGEVFTANVPERPSLHPICDDMGLCHSRYQAGDGRLHLSDAEPGGWFVRTDHIKQRGQDPYLEALTGDPPEPLIFLNIEGEEGQPAEIWRPVREADGRPCSNPRVIIPRRLVPNVVNGAVAVDVRSFGVRAPLCCSEKPTYGILGYVHILPSALAWLWRLVSPRGDANPSISESDPLASEGVGSYEPFLIGDRVTQANLLLRQFQASSQVWHIITPNQHVGAWHVGFMPQWIVRDVLLRRRIDRSHLVPARCPLLGFALRELRVGDTELPRGFLQVEHQPEVEFEGYDRGAAAIGRVFETQLRRFLAPNLDPLGRRIIECCLDRGSVQAFEALLPGRLCWCA